MYTRTVIHKISERYQIIEHQLIDNGKIVEVFFKVSDYDNNEYGGKYDELSEAISYIKDITFS